MECWGVPRLRAELRWFAPSCGQSPGAGTKVGQRRRLIGKEKNRVEYGAGGELCGDPGPAER